MTQLDLKTTARRSFLYLSEGHYQHVYRLADDALLRRTRNGIDPSEWYHYEDLMIYGMVAATLEFTAVKIRLKRQGITLTQDRLPRGLLKVTDDPYGIYHLQVLAKRYLRSTGHVDGTVTSSLIMRRYWKVIDWLADTPNTRQVQKKPTGRWAAFRERWLMFDAEALARSYRINFALMANYREDQLLAS